MIILLLCVGSFIHAQEYQLSEIEDIAYTFFNRGPRYIQGGDHTLPTKQIASMQAINRNETNYMYLANAENSLGWVILSNEKHILQHRMSDGSMRNEKIANNK